MLDPSEKRFIRNGRGNVRLPQSGLKAWEQACRSRWRSLLLCIKAKMESIESEIEQFDEAFLPQMMDPSTRNTSAETIVPQIKLNCQQDVGTPVALLARKTPPKG